MYTVGTRSIIWPSFVLPPLTTWHPSSRNSLLYCGLSLSFLSAQPPTSCLPISPAVVRYGLTNSIQYSNYN